MFLEKLQAPIALTFDDVLLVPAKSHIEPNEADIRTRFSRNIPLHIPLVSSAMDTVTESSMAIALAREGGIGVLHRNMTPEQEVYEIRLVKQAEELIERQVVSVDPDISVAEVERLMNEHRIIWTRPLPVQHVAAVRARYRTDMALLNFTWVESPAHRGSGG